MITFPIIEIFSSIQGEGCKLGKPANFIRFAGCNLKCVWCDTDWSRAKEGNLSIEQIIERIDPTVELVVLTGGEPLIQKDLILLIEELIRRQHKIAIETNGTQPAREIISRLYAQDLLRDNLWISCSPKPQTNWSIDPFCVFNELKYVVDDTLSAKNIRKTNAPVWLQPEGSTMQNSWKKALQIQKELQDRFDVRIGVQLHKIMEVR